jgi:hypothetical protein
MSFENIANFFYDKGFNISIIKNVKNSFNKNENNLSKSPGSDWQELFDRKQTKEEFDLLDYNNATGLLTFAGFDNLVVIDIDYCVKIEFVYDILEKIGIDKQYSWIVRTGNGFHIYFKLYFNLDPYCNYALYRGDPKEEYKFVFSKIEFLFKTNIVLPGSIHRNGKKYGFVKKLVHDLKLISIEDINLIFSSYCIQTKKLKNYSICGQDFYDIHGYHAEYHDVTDVNNLIKKLIDIEKRELVEIIEFEKIKKLSDIYTPNNSWISIILLHLGFEQFKYKLLKPLEAKEIIIIDKFIPNYKDDFIKSN